MQVATGSDIHLEMGAIKLVNTENAKVLLLCGDICVSIALMSADTDYFDMRSQRIHDFFTNCGREFEHVIYVAGNHEHYRGDFATTITNLKSKLAYIPNLHILDKESVTIDDITFVGGTLWTDMNKSDPASIAHIKQSMNDFRVIDNSNCMVQYNSYDIDGNTVKRSRPAIFTPYDAEQDHQLMLAYIKTAIDPAIHPETKFVIVGHHSPSFQSVSAEFKHDILMNGGYHSNLDNFISDNPQILLWLHGHTHSAHDYVIGNTRILCNPRGYIGYESIANTFELRYIDI